MNRLVSGTVALIFDPMTRAMGDGGVFLLFTFIAATSFVYSCLVVPETKGESCFVLRAAL
jgi:hypothetical protein